MSLLPAFQPLSYSILLLYSLKTNSHFLKYFLPTTTSGHRPCPWPD
jgi:hypothetical protein